MNPNFLAQLLNENSGYRNVNTSNTGPYRAPTPPTNVAVCNMCVQYHGALEGISTDINFLKETILMLQNKWSGILYNSFLLQHQSIAANQMNLQQQHLIRANSLNRHLNPRLSVDKPSSTLGGKQDVRGNGCEAAGDSSLKDPANVMGGDEELSLDEARLRVLSSLEQNLGLNPNGLSANDIANLRNGVIQPPSTVESTKISTETKRSYTRSDLGKFLNLDTPRDGNEVKSDIAEIKTVEIPDPTFSDALNFKGITWLVKKKGWCVFYVEKGKIQQENFTPNQNEKQDDVLKRALDFRRNKCRAALEKEGIQVLPVTPSEDEVKEYFLGLNRSEGTN